MTNQPEPLVEGWQLFRLGQLPAAIRLAKAAISSPGLVPQAQLLLVRCLFEQGHLRQAKTICSTALATLPPDSSFTREIRLRRAFLQIYLSGHSTPILEEGWAVLTEESQNFKLRAIAQDLLGRERAIALTWHLAPQSALEAAKHLLSEAIHSYQQAEDHDAVLATLIKFGQFYLLGSRPNQQLAQQTFQQVLEQARTIDNRIRQAEAQLLLAELALKTSMAQGATDSKTSLDLMLYEQALESYKIAGHALGAADVHRSLGRCLIEADLDGSNALQQALQIYRQEENLTGIWHTLGDLSTWHLKRGDLSQSLEYRQQAIAIAGEMGFPLAQATTLIGIGDYYFRIGDYARALAAYEQVEQFTSLPSVRSMCWLNLANVYTLMHLPERAEAICQRAIATLKPTYPSKDLSLAYFILGNVLTGQNNWAAAIPVWREGLTVDEAMNNALDQAEKLKCIAQATVMQHYRFRNAPIPETAYTEAMTLFDQAIALLKPLGSQEVEGAIAGVYQLQGQIAITCQRPLEALQYMEQARDAYAAATLNMQTAVTDTLIGLLCHDLGGRGYPDLYAEAIRFYGLALDYFQSSTMVDMSWKPCFYLAQTFFRQGCLALTAAEQQELWYQADQWLQQAASDIELVRGRFIEADPLSREMARLGLVTGKEKVYTYAIQLHCGYLKDNCSAFDWLERFKGRVFLDGLALTPIRSPTLGDTMLLDQERDLLKALRNASTQVEVVDLSDRLHILWNQMATDPMAAEYVTLRRGEPTRWETLKGLLHQSVTAASDKDEPIA